MAYEKFSPENARPEERREPALHDLSDFARFSAERMKAEAGQSTSKVLKEGKAKSAQEHLDIAFAITALVDRGLHTIDQTIAELHERSTKTEQRITKTTPNGQAERLIQESKTYFRATEFLEAFRNTDLNKRADFKAWQAAKVAELQRKLDAKKTAQTQPAPRESSPVNEQKEIERQRERYIQMVLQDGGARAHMAFPPKSVPNHNNCSYETVDDSRTRTGPIMQAGRNVLLSLVTHEQNARHGTSGGDVLAEHQRAEMVGFDRAKVPVFEKIEIPAVHTPEVRGFFGSIKQKAHTVPARIEQRPTGVSRAALHSEVVTNGKSEPLVWLAYHANTYNPKFAHNGMAWRCPDGRQGQFLDLEIALPESVALHIQQALEKDPALIRQIAERIIKQKIIQAHPEAWEKSLMPEHTQDALRPPFEKWDQASGGKIYIQPLDAPRGWHEEYDRTIVVK